MGNGEVKIPVICMSSIIIKKLGSKEFRILYLGLKTHALIKSVNQKFHSMVTVKIH